ncbi:hypothetical protein COLO4_31059 [Corchorus olitorius]|uniref:C2H2-type domain-containing protein n=1 Tax=Corchorus olitorius TaxID=93759 RepID=A0A1R3H5T6_9ROSI|nr:hypothetical protein COLO4_31059 [Corchorus olitorius]
MAKEDAEKQVGTKSCFYCHKVFSNYRALGGHLRIHQEDRMSRNLNCPSRSSNSMDITRNPPVPLPNSQQNSSVGGNNPTPFTTTPPPFDFPRMVSNETNQASRSRFVGSNPGVAQGPVIMPPDFSTGYGGGVSYQHNALASRAFAPAGANAVMSTAFPSSASVVATGFPIDSSLYAGGSHGICQFNTDQFQISRDGLPPPPGDALQNFQGYNLGKLRNHFSITNPDHSFGSYHLPGFNESIVVSAVSPGPPPSSNLDKRGHYEGGSSSKHEAGKRPYLADGSGDDDKGNKSKKPKIAPTADAEPETQLIAPSADAEPETPHQLKGLILFMDVDDSISAPQAAPVAEAKVPADVDLSLHL